MILFSIIRNGEAFEGKLLYETSTHSFCYQLQKSVRNDVSIVCGFYTFLDVNSHTGRACMFAGLSSKEWWVLTKLNYPTAEQGQLYAHFSRRPIPGEGVIYDDSWLVFADEDSHCICVGFDTEISEDDQVIEFAKGVIAVVSKSGVLKSIWAQYEEVTHIDSELK